MSNAPKYEVAIRDVAERRRIISEKSATPSKVETCHEYPSGAKDLPVIHIDLGLPVYRLENYRTQRQQLGYAKDRHLDAKFFKNGQENVSAQQAQHELLLQFARQGSGDTIKPIYEVLEEGRAQTHSLLITMDGVVVNGNRRLAAMRELYKSNASLYASFSSVRAMVLPLGLTQLEIKLIETRLQMTPQTKLPYDWVNECLAIRDLRANGVSDDAIAAEMKLDDPDMIDHLLGRLNEGELYLSEYLKEVAPFNYEKIASHKQQFTELQKALEEHESAASKELARRINNVLTRESDNLGSRAYDYRTAFGSDLAEVVAELSERLSVASDSNSPVTIPVDDIFDTGTKNPLAQHAQLIDRLSDLSQSAAIAEELTEVCDSIRDGRKKDAATKAALKKVTKAHGLLNEVNITNAAPDTLAKIAAQLTSITARVTQIGNAIRERQSGT